MAKNGRKTAISSIGIPRSFVYHLDVFNWPEFFRLLNCSVLFSNDSNYQMFINGFNNAKNDQCFPVKLFIGHVLDLVNQADAIFIPQIISTREKTYSCPKIIGLPNLIRHSINNPLEVVSVTINLNYKIINILNVIKLAFRISYNPVCIFRAIKHFIDRFNTLISMHTNKGTSEHHEYHPDKNIGIIGHRYALAETFLNFNIMKKIQKMNVGVIIPNGIQENSHSVASTNFNCRPFHWEHGHDVLAIANSLLQDDRINGIILLTFFGCGLDAFIEEIIKNKISSKKPFLSIMLDEHTGEAGIITRIEAFIDMMR